MPHLSKQGLEPRFVRRGLSSGCTFKNSIHERFAQALSSVVFQLGLTNPEEAKEQVPEFSLSPRSGE